MGIGSFLRDLRKFLGEGEYMGGGKREMAGAQEPSGGRWEFSGAAGTIWENGFEVRIHSPRWGAFAP
ncbi:hypothetical protein [Lacrimispora celerecrescens]|uniref:hypothetical protein n=1 Tax=Lacrimispora celerecrescens TaxID=29354 RepID=UPI0016484F70|nr:hypothetical protein [Lacrimispora celerecrescens]